METKKIKLPSGVECSIIKMHGDMQEYFTSPKYTKDGSGILKMLSEVIVKLGSLSSITQEQAGTLLDKDVKHLLLHVRQFSMKRHPDFKFEYMYSKKDEKGKKTEVTEEIVMPFDWDNFPMKPYDFQAKEYSEIWEGGDLETREFKLIDAKVTVKWRPLMWDDGKNILGMTAEDRSTNSLVKARHPRYFHQKNKDKEGTWINLDLKQTTYDDLEDLRAEFKRVEGDQDTMMLYMNPETKREEAVDVTLLPAFFFPSQAR